MAVFGPDTVPVKAPEDVRRRARERLVEALQAVHLRGEVHITARELRAALIFILFGLHSCAEYHEVPETKPLPYWDLAFDPTIPGRQGEVLRELARFDPALEAHPQIDRHLLSEQGYPNAIWRLAEGLCQLMSKTNLWGNLYGGIDSFLFVNQPNGLAAKRRVRERDLATGRRTREIRSLVFTDSVLDYLVHVHLLRSGNHEGVRPLSFKEFLRLIRERYGFCVDEAVPGMTISNDLLQANRAILERRLRDLGLLRGVNDAEAMKRLRPRFTPREEGTNAAD